MAWSIWDYGILATFLLLLFYYVKQSNVFFKNKGVKTSKAYPLIGNLLDVVRRKKHFLYVIKDVYTAFPNEKYVGFYQFKQPMLIIKDIETIKTITVKDFDHFQDHQIAFDENSEPLFGKNLAALKGQRWRDMRATLSPAFTSSKMRNMFNFIADCGKHTSEFYLQKVKSENTEGGFVEVELKDTFTRFMNDVIATTAFGVKVDSLKEQDNMFFKMGTRITNFSTWQQIKILGMAVMPSLMKLLKIGIFGAETQNFFRSLVISQMKEREEKNIVRQDMIHLLMDAKKGTLKHEKGDNGIEGFATVNESSLGQRIITRKLDDDDVVAQAILFFFGGFDTTSTLLCYLTHELTLNPDVQQKLQCEIDKVRVNNKGDLEYNEIQNMKYLDMVVSEALRKWPPGFVTERQCVKAYTLPPSTPNSKPVQMNVNDTIWIPVYCIHRDPQYYNDPDKFDPERFSDENKSSIQAGTYIPFGLGPRNCIGSRFALLTTKSIIFHLLSTFDLVPTSKTLNPLVLSKTAMTLIPDEKFWIGLKPRNGL